MENLNQQRQNAINGVIAQFNEALAGHRAALNRYRNVLLGQGHVVMLNGFAVNFELVPQAGGVMANNPRPISLLENGLQMFAAADAAQLAAGVRDGNGQQAQAMHIVAAHNAAIDELNANIANLQAIEIN